MNTFEQLREKASEIEACEFNFLGPDGKFAKTKSAYVTFEVVFIDGTRMLLPRSETEKPGFDELQFKLRPARDN